MHGRRQNIVFTAVLLSAGFSLTQLRSAPLERPPLAIVNVGVIDTVARRLVTPCTVLIVDGRITAVGESFAVSIPDGAVEVDGRGRFLIPGLVDMHVHLFNNSSQRPPNEWAFPLCIANGVTGVREMRSVAAQIPIMARWRAEVERGELVAPRVLAAGIAVRGESVDEARRQVREAKSAGADFIKVFSDVPAMHWRAILDEARAGKLTVCGHTPAEVSALTAAKAGQRSNEHLMQLFEACSSMEGELLAARQGFKGASAEKIRETQEAQVLETFDQHACEKTAAALAKTDQFQVPTLVLPHSEANRVRPKFREDFRWQLLPSDEQERWTRILEQTEENNQARQRWEVARKIVAALHSAGVPILAGTDAPMPLVYPGDALHDELGLLVECGLSPAEALRAATLGPAEFLGIADTSGSIAVGKRADLILLDDNPLRDISNTRKIRAVVLSGRLIERPDLDALLEKASRRAEPR
ncbi:MAG: amidohydrolase family protein [Chthoniobacterales bacterium]